VNRLRPRRPGTPQPVSQPDHTQQDRQHLQAIISSVPIILFAVDRNGVITFEDGQALAALGAKPGQDVGRRLQDVYPQYPVLLEHMRRALSGERFNAPVAMGPLMFDCWYSPMRTARGEITGYLGVAMNITERHRLERQLLSITDRERARLGQEIHDGLCQHLVSLAFDANALEQQLEAAGRPEALAARNLAGLLDEALTQARQLSGGLFPVPLAREGLCAALEDLARSTEQRAGIRCQFQAPQAVAVEHQSTAIHLYRIAQEAVANAVRHARASTIRIGLSLHGEALVLEIEDDGTGLDTKRRGHASGMGLYIMDYRARSIGASLRLGPAARGGTRVSCSLPRGALH
jgi:PAS domain S-box-containing protein